MGVETAVRLGVVVLELDDGVFAHGDGESVLGLLGAEGVDGGAFNGLAAAASGVDRIDVDGDEQVATGVVGDVGSALEGEVSVIVASEEDIDLGALASDDVGDTACDIESDGFLVCEPAYATGIFAAVSGVEARLGARREAAAASGVMATARAQAQMMAQKGRRRENRAFMTEIAMGGMVDKMAIMSRTKYAARAVIRFKRIKTL